MSISIDKACPVRAAAESRAMTSGARRGIGAGSVRLAQGRGSLSALIAQRCPASWKARWRLWRAVESPRSSSVE